MVAYDGDNMLREATHTTTIVSFSQFTSGSILPQIIYTERDKDRNRE